MRIYQCIPSYRPVPASRNVRQALENGATVLLDLEDAIQDVKSESKTGFLKAIARKDLEMILQQFPSEKFSIRINPVHSPYYAEDLKLVHHHAEQVHSVFLPKIESREQLNQAIFDLPDQVKINPIIESETGIQQLNEILDHSFKQHIDYIFFGNYDYHLSKGIYPVNDQDTSAYWDLVSTMIETIEENGFSFGNSPFTHLTQFTVMQNAMARLSAKCKNDFALMSLHIQQTKCYSSKMPSSSHPEKPAEKIDPETFLKNQQKNRSFSLINDRIITPQEYQLMLRHDRMH